MKQARETAPTKDLLTYFDTLHRDTLGVPAVIRPGKDAKQIATLWRSHGDQLVRDLMADFFASNDRFIQDAGYTVGVFVSQAGKLIARRHKAWTRAADADWFDECKRLHGGQCGGRLRHANQLEIDAAKARKEPA